MNFPTSGVTPAALAARLRAARGALEALVATLPSGREIGPYSPIANPPLWEYGHIVWFQEHWCLRLKPDRSPQDSPLLAPLEPARRDWADWLYDSSHIPHQARWHAPLPSLAATRDYGTRVLDAVCAKLAAGAFEADFLYYVELSLLHELMHTEAWWMCWQHFGLTPPWRPAPPRFTDTGLLAIAPGKVRLGSPPDAGFVFDNEKWAHEQDVAAFDIDARPVTCGEYADFVDAGGYAREEFWTEAGRHWLAASGACYPQYWRSRDGRWALRRFDRWEPLDPAQPVLHASRHEAQAYARFRGRRLPSAAQWLRAFGADGFRPGRCWEWTADAFSPYAGFAPDPYRDYSLPWFGGEYAELRGAGSLVTDAALARPGYRNFYMPERRDPFVGFRTVSAPD